jgi:predicted metal-dependent peptidase
MPLPYPIVEARSRLLYVAPYIGSYVLCECQTVYDPSLPNAATDGHRIILGDWFCGLTLDQRLYVLAHEGFHVVFKHMERIDLYKQRQLGPDLLPFGEKRFNMAADYYINDLNVKAGIGTPPPGVLLSPLYTTEKTVDQIYLALPPQDDEQRQDGDPAKNGDSGNFDTHLSSGGSGATGATEQELQQAVIDTLAQIDMTAKLAGVDLPSGLSRVIGSVVTPKVPWHVALRQFCQSVSGRSEVTWSRINRRRLIGPPHLPYPGRDGHKIDSLILAIDSSGSISAQELAAFVAEMKAIMEDLSPVETWVLWWDTRVTPVRIEYPDDLDELTPMGGGGTRYRCVPEWLNQQGIDPDLIICMTDLAVSWPDPATIHWPHLTVGTVPEQYSADCPFGTTIRLDLD